MQWDLDEVNLQDIFPNQIQGFSEWPSPDIKHLVWHWKRCTREIPEHPSILSHKVLGKFAECTKKILENLVG